VKPEAGIYCFSQVCYYTDPSRSHKQVHSLQRVEIARCKILCNMPPRGEVSFSKSYPLAFITFCLAEEKVRIAHKKGRFPYQPVVSPSLLNIGTGATLSVHFACDNEL
jgi:hypothetical protein